MARYRAHEPLTQDRLKELVSYDPDTGVFTRKVLRTGARKTFSDTTPQNGRLRVNIDGKFYFTNRLAWLYMTGAWPAHDVDHRDLNPLNDAWLNLRAATIKQNCENSKEQTNNTSGHRGVHWFKNTKKWCSRITHHNRRISLGHYEDFDEAVEIRQLAEQMLFTHAPGT